jgi:release factor glutamine methyltransferase
VSASNPHPPVASAPGPPTPTVRERERKAIAADPLARTAGEGARGRSARAGKGVSASTPSASTVGSAIAAAAGALSAAGFDEPRRQARRLLAEALGLSAAELFAHPENSLTAAQEGQIAPMLGRMVAHEPFSRIIGKREFWGLEFLLSEDTLDPRPDSESVVEAVLSRLADRARYYRFLDLGTGTGCLLLALLSEFPRAIGVGVDVAAGAVRAAWLNAERLGFGERAHFAVGDWAAAIAGRFDVIIANPPYIPTAVIPGLMPEVRDCDPHLALDGGADGLAAYRGIAADLPRLLLPGGLFAAEIGAGQAACVSAILEQNGLAIDGFAADLGGVIRCVVARR